MRPELDSPAKGKPLGPYDRVSDRRCRRVYLPDRGGRRECDREAESSNECHKDEFRAHSAASHLYLHSPSSPAAYGRPVRRFKPRMEPDPQARSRFASIYSLTRSLLAGRFEKK